MFKIEGTIILDTILLHNEFFLIRLKQNKISVFFRIGLLDAPKNVFFYKLKHSFLNIKISVKNIKVSDVPQKSLLQYQFFSCTHFNLYI